MNGPLPEARVETLGTEQIDGVTVVRKRIIRGDRPCKRCHLIRSLIIIFGGTLLIGIAPYVWRYLTNG